MGYIEGTSMLVILFVTMPLKYLMDIGTPNKVVGMTHGILFIAYVLMLVTVALDKRWPSKKTLLGVLAAVVPFGPFVFDRQLEREASH